MKVPEHIDGIQPYVPGKPIEELERELGIREAVKLASNENPLGPSPKAIDAAREALTGVNRYPDGGGYYLTRALAAHWNVSPSQILLGNGSNELIELAVRTFMVPGDEAVMAHPSFVVYDSIVRAVGGRSIPVPLSNGRHDLKAMALRVSDATRLCFIANPNNPTGTTVNQEEVAEWVQGLPDHCLLIMDEAYYEYVTDPAFPDSLGFLREGRPVLVLRTFSKAYGLAGLRIGYALGPAEVITAMNRIRQPFNTNTLAQVAALAALGDSGHLTATRKVNQDGKAYLEGELDRLGLKRLPSQTNFIFIPLPKSLPSSQVYEALLRRGVIVRPAGPAALRVTIGLEGENRAFVEAMEAFLGQEGR